MTFNKLHLGKYTVTRGHFITIEIFFLGGRVAAVGRGQRQGHREQLLTASSLAPLMIPMEVHWAHERAQLTLGEPDRTCLHPKASKSERSLFT